MRDQLTAVELAELAKQQTEGHGVWSSLGFLVVALIDEVRWLRHAVYHAQGGKPKEPHQFPRPGVLPPSVDVLAPKARNYFEQMRERDAAAKAAHHQATQAGGQQPAGPGAPTAPQPPAPPAATPDIPERRRVTGFGGTPT